MGSGGSSLGLGDEGRRSRHVTRARTVRVEPRSARRRHRRFAAAPRFSPRIAQKRAGFGRPRKRVVFRPWYARRRGFWTLATVRCPSCFRAKSTFQRRDLRLLSGAVPALKRALETLDSDAHDESGRLHGHRDHARQDRLRTDRLSLPRHPCRGPVLLTFPVSTGLRSVHGSYFRRQVFREDVAKPASAGNLFQMYRASAWAPTRSVGGVDRYGLVRSAFVSRRLATV